MAPVTSSQRLVPIRPSPLKSASSEKNTIGTVSCGATTMKSSAKRKLSDLGAQDGKCKRLNTGGSKSSQSSSMGRRNARERNRVKQVNNSFVTLRQHIPGASKAKKISKVETLKQATDYIRSLQRLLEEHDAMLTMSEKNQFSSGQSRNTVVKSEVPQEYVQQLPQLNTPGSVVIPQHDNSPAPEQASIFTSYYYPENISPVSPLVYPLNDVNQVPLSSDDASIFSADVKLTPAQSFTSTITLPTSDTYSTIMTPSTPVSQISFSLPPSTPYSNTSVSYPITVTYSPSSIPTQSPNPGTTFSPGSLSQSPSSSPAAINAPDISPVYAHSFEESKPSLIQARNFIIPASELPYCYTPEMTTIDIDKATATTHADLELLDAIAFWQDC
ncbi:achaete-scute complex protein T8 [Hyalella azteca]|uniref:Achaete-scute complex protein T8 n=1 Tax=Hyalella azteca TaxID=294128 RepID=A0A8B7PRY3_HYAAZ|nr:achaete-scute complex protein T8 [Hyalella azteca]